MNKNQKDQETSGTETLTEIQKEQFGTLRKVLRVQIDGDWDEMMIRTAFEDLEKLLFKLGSDEDPGDRETPKRSRGKSGSSGKRKGKKN